MAQIQQAAFADNGPSQTSGSSFSIPINATANNTLVAFMVYTNGSTTIATAPSDPTVAANVGGGWSSIGASSGVPVSYSGGQGVGPYDSSNLIKLWELQGIPTGITGVTFTFSSPITGYQSYGVLEISGVPSSNSRLEVDFITRSNNTNPPGPTNTATAGNALLVAIIGSGYGGASFANAKTDTWTPSTGWTSLSTTYTNSSTNNPLSIASRVYSGATSCSWAQYLNNYSYDTCHALLVYKPASATTVPSAPGTPTATAGNGQANLTWTDGSNGGSPIIGHKIYAYINNTGTTATVANGGLTSGTLNPQSTPSGVATGGSFTGLVPGNTYYFKVQSSNGIGSSALSTNYSNSVIIPTAPPNPTLGNVSNNTTGTSWTINWSQSTPSTMGAIDGYYITFNGATPSGYATGNRALLTSVGTATSATISGGSFDAVYNYTVQAHNIVDYSPGATQSVTLPNVPDPVTVDPVTNITGSTWSDTWNAPYAHNAAITGYQIIFDPPAAPTGPVTFQVSSFVPVGNINSITFTGATPGTTYAYRVKAQNSVGLSLRSNTTTVTPGPPPTPNAPTSSNVGYTTFDLSWAAPVLAAGAASITQYVVLKNGATVYTTPDANTFTLASQSLPTSSTADQWTVKAVSSGGTSQPSPVLNMSGTLHASYDISGSPTTFALGENSASYSIKVTNTGSISWNESNIVYLAINFSTTNAATNGGAWYIMPTGVVTGQQVTVTIPAVLPDSTVVASGSDLYGTPTFGSRYVLYQLVKNNVAWFSEFAGQSVTILPTTPSISITDNGSTDIITYNPSSAGSMSGVSPGPVIRGYILQVVSQAPGGSTPSAPVQSSYAAGNNGAGAGSFTFAKVNDQVNYYWVRSYDNNTPPPYNLVSNPSNMVSTTSVMHLRSASDPMTLSDTMVPRLVNAVRSYVESLSTADNPVTSLRNVPIAINDALNLIDGLGRLINNGRLNPLEVVVSRDSPINGIRGVSSVINEIVATIDQVTDMSTIRRIIQPEVTTIQDIRSASRGITRALTPESVVGQVAISQNRSLYRSPNDISILSDMTSKGRAISAPTEYLATYTPAGLIGAIPIGSYGIGGTPSYTLFYVDTATIIKIKAIQAVENMFTGFITLEYPINIAIAKFLSDTILTVARELTGYNYYKAKDTLVTTDTQISRGAILRNLNELSAAISDTTLRTLAYQRAMSDIASSLDVLSRMVQGTRIVYNDILYIADTIGRARTRYANTGDTLPLFVDSPLKFMSEVADLLPQFFDYTSTSITKNRTLLFRDFIPALLDILDRSLTRNINVVQRSVLGEGTVNIGPAEALPYTDDTSITLNNVQVM